MLGYEGCYEVSDYGRVRSLDRWTRCGNRGHGQKLQQGRVLSPITSKRDGRRRVTLSVNQQKKLRTIAPMVLEAFVEPRPTPDMDCCHGDGNPAHDMLGNLRWDTKKANHADSVRHGTSLRANQTHCKWGHELAAPNLTDNPRGRTCRACADTRGWARHRGIPTGDQRWLAEADRRYALITTGRYDKTPRPNCPRSHILTAPNLVSRVSGRVCLTCSNTRAWAFYYGLSDDDPRWIAEADQRYAAIMAGEKKVHRGPGKTKCGRRHLLQSPNLRAGKVKRCLACSSAQSWAYARSIPVGDPRWTAEADRRYAQIMATSQGR